MPPMKKNGITGINAPSAVDTADANADLVGFGKFSSARPNSSAAIVRSICSGSRVMRSAKGERERLTLLFRLVLARRPVQGRPGGSLIWAVTLR